jgi:hypothetical protein
MKIFLKNQKGVSMVGVLMAAAMAGGVALLVAQIGKNSNQITQETNANNDINALVNRIEKYMLHSESCNETITQFPSLINGGGPIGFGNKKIKSNYSGIVSDQLAVGDKIGKVTVAAIQIERKNSNEVDIILSIDKKGGLNSPTEVFNPDGSLASQSGRRIIQKRINLHSQFTGNVPSKCFSQLDNAVSSAVKRICDNFGGAYDSTTVNCTPPPNNLTYQYSSHQVTARNTTYGYNKDFCFLTKIENHDEWKDSSTHKCHIVQTGKTWRLTSWDEESRGVLCAMTCIVINY